MAKFVCVIMVLASLGALSFAGMNKELADMLTEGEKVVRKCQNQEKVSDDDLQKLWKDKKVDEKIGCFLYCLAKDYKMIDDKYVVSEDSLAEFIKPIEEEMKRSGQENMFKSIQEVAMDCLGKKNSGIDGCEVAQIYGQCIIDGVAEFLNF